MSNDRYSVNDALRKSEDVEMVIMTIIFYVQYLLTPATLDIQRTDDKN